MSFVLSFKDKNYVAMAGDKRLTNIQENTFEDTCKKVYKINNYIYGTCGSGVLSELFRSHNKARNLKEFRQYYEDYFENLEKTKTYSLSKDNWIRQKFDLTLQVVGIDNNNTFAAQLNISWKRKGIIGGTLPTPTSRDIPMFCSPNLGDYNNTIESYMKNHYPLNINDARIVAQYLISNVSRRSNLVSPAFDFEYLQLGAFQ